MPRLHSALSSDHPAARGHFPGNPVIPGAVLLSDTVRAIAEALGADLSCCRVSAAKFRSFARPGDGMTIDYTGSRDQGAEFTCSVDGRTVLTGNVAWGETPKRM